MNRASLTWALIVGQESDYWLNMPPKGWRSIDILAWGYKTYLEKLGHKVYMISTRDQQEIVNQLNEYRPDVVHLHYIGVAGVLKKCDAPVKIITCHQPIAPFAHNRHDKEIILDFFRKHFVQYLRDGLFFFSLSLMWKNMLLDCGYRPDEIFITPNGVDSRKFRFRDTPLHGDRSIYLGTVSNRKRQQLYQSLDCIDFVGALHRPAMGAFDETRSNYLGVWTRDDIHAHLSDYANLVILSKAEAAAPLVVLEALICGLGVVVSAAASGNLDTRLPWVTVIPEDKITDLRFVKAEIARNREISLRHRAQIREHGIENFCWEKLVSRYADLCRKLHTDKIGGGGATHAQDGPLPPTLLFDAGFYSNAGVAIWAGGA